MHTGVQEGEFAQSMFKRRIIEFGVGEGFLACKKGHFRAGPALVLAAHFQRLVRHAMGEVDLVDPAGAADPELQLR
ncbi:hypothetical protein D3C87_2117260 [compost metagenome]